MFKKLALGIEMKASTQVNEVLIKQDFGGGGDEKKKTATYSKGRPRLYHVSNMQ